MSRHSFACLGFVFSLLVAAVPPATAQSVSVEVHIGTSLNNGRAITCRDGERILRNRGFRDVRRVDCRGRFFIYHARRISGRFEIAVSAHNGRVVDLRRLGR